MLTKYKDIQIYSNVALSIPANNLRKIVEKQMMWLGFYPGYSFFPYFKFISGDSKSKKNLHSRTFKTVLDLPLLAKKSFYRGFYFLNNPVNFLVKSYYASSFLNIAHFRVKLFLFYFIVNLCINDAHVGAGFNFQLVILAESAFCKALDSRFNLNLDINTLPELTLSMYNKNYC